MTEQQTALATIWRYKDELYALAEGAKDATARRIYRNANTALGRVVRPFGKRPPEGGEEVVKVGTVEGGAA